MLTCFYIYIFPPVPPGPPVSPVATDTTQSTISLSWTVPATDGGAPILGYLVECKRTDIKDWIRCNVPKNLQDTHYVISGLLTGSQYQVRVTAVNKVGFSEPAELADKPIVKDILGMYCNTVLLTFTKVDPLDFISFQPIITPLLFPLQLLPKQCLMQS